MITNRSGMAGRHKALAASLLLASAVVSAAVGAADSELAAWNKAKSLNTCQGYRAFLAGNPGGKLSGLADKRLEALGCQATVVPPAPVSPLSNTGNLGPGSGSGTGQEDDRLWAVAAASGDCAAYRGYLTAYPTGQHVAEANRESARTCVRPKPIKPPSLGRRTHPPQPMATPPPTIDNAQSGEALNFIRDYYSAMDRADAAAVAAMWDSPPSSIYSQVANNEWFRINQSRVLAIDSDSARVFVDVTGKDHGRRAEHWRVNIDLVRSGDTWKIKSMGR
jgi:hypothetical protein